MFATPLEQVQKKLSASDAALSGVSVLVLPENIETASVEALRDTSDSIEFAKHLKSKGIACKTAFDFGVEPKVYDRRAADVWLGVIWIMEHVAAPTVVGALLIWLNEKYRDRQGTRVHLDLHLQDGTKTAKLSFDGPMDSLDKVLTGLRQPEDDRLNDQRK